MFPVRVVRIIIDLQNFDRAMTRDEKLYPDPLKFKPERFFDNDGKLDNNKRVLAYGFGRRYG